MAVEVTTRQAHFEARAEDGLHAVVHRAAKVVASDEVDSGGLLAITPEDSSSGPGLRIEAAFSDDGLRRAIASLDVHFELDLERVEPSLALGATAAFGGTRYTNLCFGPAAPGPAAEDLESLLPRGEDALDVTVTFPTGLPLFARNLALLGDRWSAHEREVAMACLGALGVWHRASAAGVTVLPYQLRAPVTSEGQARALLAAVERGRTVTLFTSRIPPTRSLRCAVSVAPDGAPRRLELCVSSGLAGTEATSAEDVHAIQRFAAEHLGLELAGRTYRVESRRWTASNAAPAAAEASASRTDR